MRPEPDRDHRGRRDRAARDLGRGLVVPEDRVAVPDRRAGRPDVAALDVELADLLVALLADPGLDLGRQIGTLGHDLSSRLRRRRPRCASARSARARRPPPRAARRCPCATRRAPAPARAARGMPGERGRHLAEAARARMLRLGEHAARAELRVLDELVDRVHGRDAGVVGRELGDPVVAVARAERGREVGADLLLRGVVGLVREPLLAAEPPAQVRVELRARSRRPPPSGRRGTRRCRSTRSARSECRGRARASARLRETGRCRARSAGARPPRRRRRGTRPRPCARAAGAPRGSRARRACRPRRCRPPWRPGSAARRRRAGRSCAGSRRPRGS